MTIYAAPVFYAAQFPFAGALTGVAQNASKPYSLKPYDANSWRFEAHPGEQAPFDSPYPYKVRSEVSSWGRINAGKLFTASFGFLFEEGPPSNYDWLSAFQIHADDKLAASPIAGIDITPGDVLAVTVDSAAGQAGTILWSTPLVRGHLYDVGFAFVDSRGGPGGSLVMTLDGVHVANYSGPTGYTAAVAPSYAKTGIYAGNANRMPTQSNVLHVVGPQYAFGA